MMKGGIIVEGAEQQGKSTFCNRLKDALGIEVIHMDKASPNFDYFSGYFEDIERLKCPIIYDRSYISELVYGRYFGRNNINTELKDRIESKFKDLGYFIVLLELNRPWVDREEMITREQNENIKSLYREIYHSLDLDKFIIKPDDEGLEFVVKQFKERQNII